ncbi:pyridine nucleotide-disulfide oxidoreductase [Aeromicrobium sp. Root495]|uniref:dihydrolipoyl dehydrogenase family protein n=1 Tax=Aeromicrobium sp. Root495 TaxID=1736550 RepID=UPI0006F25F26|nr:NAD(P)/FAD-dependent oxidoreductase [Aeromicrobium sp. Root495]KQY60303.1 pyridine nucleotide-disulfide oxidoreductase [Aeromicrobium sp. Root495]
MTDEAASVRQCDVVVIGLGPGGENLAGRLAREGLDVVAVESGLVGGECPYWGCIPSKMFIRAAGALQEARRVPGLAGSAQVEPDFSLVAQRIRDEATDDWDDTVAADRLTAAGATLVRGRGRLTGPRRVEVDLPDGSAEGPVVLEARRGVVLNTGTDAAVPPIDGLADTPFWTNREALEATAAPASLVVIGGGAIGLELAQAYARFGTEVSVLQSGPRILAPEEPESSALLREVFEEEGIGVHTDVSIDAVAHDGERFHVTLGDTTIEAERVLVAAGRRPRLHGIGLEEVGLDPDARLVVDDSMHVEGVDGLWAIGDIAGRGAFTHVSMYQSERVAKVILGEPVPEYDSSFPRVTFTDPEVGGVGLTEKQARDRGINVAVASTKLEESSRGFVHGPGNRGLVKLVVDADRGVVVGATSIGPSGGETLSALAVAVRAEVPLDTLRNMIYAYPTFWRAIESALPEA